MDIYECLSSLKTSIDRLNKYDIIHIQYETSFFLEKNHKRFIQLCKNIRKPIVISLHEVYDTFPGIFPRSQIQGQLLIRKLKEIVYDIRHPYQTTFQQHLTKNFYANVILVHAQYHKEILINKGVTKNKIKVIPHPIKPQKENANQDYFTDETVHLGSLGFINPTYDYSLLFDVLDDISFSWCFTWIGGLRRDGDSYLLDNIQQEIEKRNWGRKFIITGWIPEDRRDELLSNIDIYLALFSARSSSGSLATAISARRLIITRSLPLINEIQASSPMMSVVSLNKKEIIDNIEELKSNNSLCNSYILEVDKYIKMNSYRALSKQLIQVYKELLV